MKHTNMIRLLKMSSLLANLYDGDKNMYQILDILLVDFVKDIMLKSTKIIVKMVANIGNEIS
jgi:hypothetical protein